MKQLKFCFLFALAAGAIHAADYNYIWSAGTNPSQTSDGHVKFAYDNGKIKSISANPDGGCIVFTGDTMIFDSTSAAITNSTVGELVFENVVTGGTITAISSCASTVRFAGTNGVTKLGALVAKDHADIQVACPGIALDPSFNVQPSDANSRVSMRNASYTWTGASQKANGEVVFETTSSGTVSDRTSSPEEVGNTADTFITTDWSKVACNRRLIDLVVATNRAWVFNADGKTFPANISKDSRLKEDRNFSWCNMSGASVGGANTYNLIPANLFNLKLSYTNGTMSGIVQVQVQNYQALRCIYMELRQSGSDIDARVIYPRSCYVQSTNEYLRADSRFAYDQLLGVDFDILYYMTKSERTLRQCVIGNTAATSVDTHDAGVRNLHLVFKSQLITSTKPSMMAGGTYVVKGTADSKMVLRVTNQGGFPTNGTLRVQQGGEVWINGGWGGSAGMSHGVSDAKCKIYAENGGIIRLAANYPFARTISSMVLSLDGGFIDSAGPNYYMNYLTMANGAGVRFQLGGDGLLSVGNATSPKWTINGSRPSTNSMETVMLGSSASSNTRWVLDVADTGNEVDFVQDGNIRVHASLTGVAARKIGAGTMLLNGNYAVGGSLSNVNGTFFVEAGKLLVGKSDLWASGAPINLYGGATLAVANNTTNSTFGALTITKNGSAAGNLIIPEGASVTFANSKGKTWNGNMNVTMATDGIGNFTSSLRFAGGLNEEQRKLVRVNGKHLHFDADGNVYANIGLILMVK